MIVQEFGGLNGFAFYTSSILDSAGKSRVPEDASCI